MSQEKPKRRWYQFSLRTFFVLVTLVCVGFGWWVHWSKEWIRQRHEWLSGHAYTTIDPPTPAPSALAFFGEKGIQSTWYFAGERAEAERLFPEATIRPDGE